MLDINERDVRLKQSAARIAISNDKGNITYVSIDAKVCWQTTWVSWGKASDRAVIQIGNDCYQISIQRISP
jgi:hypothetical protein